MTMQWLDGACCRYAFNDMMVFRAMDTMARFGAQGPEHYAHATLIQNKTMLQWMTETATYWQTLLHGVPNRVEATQPATVNLGASDHSASRCNFSGVW